MRSLQFPLAALLVAWLALYGARLAGWAPLAPHEMLARVLELEDPNPRVGGENFASLWQFVPFALLPVAAWPAGWRVALAAAGVALGAIYQIAVDVPQWWLYFYTFFAAAGLVMLAFLASQWRLPEARYLLAGAVLFAAFGVVTKTFLMYSSTAAAPVLDSSALVLDAASFGASPSAWAVETARGNAALRRVLAIAYEALPLAVMAVFGLEVRDPARMPFGLLKGLVVCGFAAAAAYAITPVAGPAYAFAGFPAKLDALLTAAPAVAGTLPGFSPRNAFPSFHLAWALLLVMLTVRFGWAARAVFGAYALLIAFATLALGEHYLIDLVASFPILLAIAALCMERASPPRRWQALVAGLALYAAWAVLLRPSVALEARQWPMLMAAWCYACVALSIWLYYCMVKRG